MRNLLTVIFTLITTLGFSQGIPVSQIDTVAITGNELYLGIRLQNDSLKWGKFTTASLADYLRTTKIPSSNGFDGQALVYLAGQTEYGYRTFVLPSDLIDQDSTNEIQALSIDSTATTYSITLENGGVVTFAKGSSDAINQPMYVSHDTSLTFNNSKYYTSLTLTEGITYTADTADSRYGNYTVARLNFGETGYPIIFSGSLFDTVQTYSIQSGDTLTGVHQVYFENTPYGIAVSVPTNFQAIARQDTVEIIEEVDPATIKSNGIALYTGLDGLTQVNDTLVQWIDQINQDTARNATAAFEPVITGAGVNFDGDNHLEMVAGFDFQDSMSITAAFRTNATLSNIHSIMGEETEGTHFEIAYRNFDDGFYAFPNQGGPALETPGDSIKVNEMVVMQVSCADGTCEIFKNGTSVGTISPTSNVPRTLKVLGALNNTGSFPLKATLYYLSVHRATYTPSEVTEFFNYVNSKFSMGL